MKAFFLLGAFALGIFVVSATRAQAPNKAVIDHGNTLVQNYKACAAKAVANGVITVEQLVGNYCSKQVGDYVSFSKKILGATDSNKEHTMRNVTGIADKAIEDGKPAPTSYGEIVQAYIACVKKAAVNHRETYDHIMNATCLRQGKHWFDYFADNSHLPGARDEVLHTIARTTLTTLFDERQLAEYHAINNARGAK
jgi:hypothetical protein